MSARTTLGFDAIVLLSAPPEVVLRRIDSRTTNDYGETVDERERIISDLSKVEPLRRATRTHEIDATQSIADVVAELTGHVPEESIQGDTVPPEGTARGTS
jgi:thymidylate kinase